MIKQFVSNMTTVEYLERSALAPHLNGLIERLLSRGCRKVGIRNYLFVAAHLTQWMSAEGLEIAELDSAAVERFCHEHPSACACPFPTVQASEIHAAARHIMHVLKGDAPTVCADVRTGGVIEQLLEEYRRHIRDVCGLALTTSIYRVRYARLFLTHFSKDGNVDLVNLSVANLLDYCQQRAKRLVRGTKQVEAGSLRHFLRFLQLHGRCDGVLIRAVPTTRFWPLARLPKALSASQLQALYATFDRSTSTGQRDYAMAVLMAELGLRASDVARILLDDLDWREGTITLRAPKELRLTVLPLPHSVGESLVAYIRSGRPQTNDRHLFVRHSVPRYVPIDPTVVQRAIRTALDRANLSEYTPHCLRHTIAKRLIESGATLKEISDLLRHRSIDTTTIYTKVDRSSLDQIGLSWPEERQ